LLINLEEISLKKKSSSKRIILNEYFKIVIEMKFNLKEEDLNIYVNLMIFSSTSEVVELITFRYSTESIFMCLISTIL
jgi:hypothetical protein